MVSVMEIRGWVRMHPFPAGPGGEPEGGGADHDERQGDFGEHALHGGLVGQQVLRAGDQRLLAAEVADVAADHEGEDDAADAGAERPGGDQFGPLMHRLGDRRRQRPVGNVDQRIDQAEDRVGGVGVDELHPGVEAGRHMEDQIAHEQQRHRTEHDERPELTPAGHRPINQPTGQQISERIPQPHHQEHGADRGSRDAGHIGVVVQQKRRTQTERQIEPEIPGPIAGDRLERNRSNDPSSFTAAGFGIDTPEVDFLGRCSAR